MRRVKFASLLRGIPHHYVDVDCYSPCATRLIVNCSQAVLNNGTLVIFEVNREDAGSYLCRLANAGGMVYYNATLTVRSEPISIIVDPCTKL